MLYFIGEIDYLFTSFLGNIMKIDKFLAMNLWSSTLNNFF